MRYIDTSAFVKYYGKVGVEKGSDKIIELIENAKKGNAVLISSILFIGETVSVFDKWSRIKALTEEESSKLISDFLNDIIELFEVGTLIIENVSPMNIISSLDLIIRHHIPINDAIHLYTALTHKQNIEKFICSDKSLIKAAEKEGLNVFNPEKRQKEGR